MKKAIIKFEFNGKRYSRRAVFTFPSMFLSEDESNQCTSIDEDTVEHENWALVFEEKKMTYRAEFKFDYENYQYLLEPVKMVIIQNDGEEFDKEVPFTVNITNSNLYK